jgi:hypothetical protein
LTYISRILNSPGGAANVSALLLYVCGNGGGSLDIQLLSSQTEAKKIFQKHDLMYINSAYILECPYSVLCISLSISACMYHLLSILLLCIYLATYLLVYESACLSNYIPTYIYAMPTCLPTHLPIFDYLSYIYLPFHTSVYPCKPYPTHVELVLDTNTTSRLLVLPQNIRLGWTDKDATLLTNVARSGPTWYRTSLMLRRTSCVTGPLNPPLRSRLSIV